MPFFRDLCSGIVGNFRNCMTTPLTRKKLLIIGGIILAIILLIIIIVVSVPSASDSNGRDALVNVPLVEGNSDFKAYLTTNYIVSNYKYDDHFKEKTIGAQVIATSVACDAQFKDAVPQTVDQLDFLQRLVEASNFLKIAHGAQDIRTNKVNNQHSVVLAVGGGHSLDSRLSVLRNYFNYGVRLVSLASSDCTNPWAMSISGDANNITWNGANFLKAVVGEMNRLGVAIDLAGSDKTVQTSVLDNTNAPVIYRGVGFSSIVKNNINIDDDILEKMKTKAKDSLVMLSLDCSLISNNASDCTKKDFKALLNTAKSKLGVANIGIGGLRTGAMPKDLGYGDFPALFDELKNEGWAIHELELLAGNNFINFLQNVEEEAKNLAAKKQQPAEDLFDIKSLNIKTDCYTPLPDPNPTPQPTQAPTTAPTSVPTEAPTTTPTAAPNATTKGP
ncbi:dipeptidase 3 [Halyomorpha halys]|uniref:dipeptidase 3 n=1 Tax=Halyomorpha halys TaxID=286706 RepID=UPI0006D4CE40|nr:dipeptidase 3-like [Halyomorpha halys]